jgi:hypothetical protein
LPSSSSSSSSSAPSRETSSDCTWEPGMRADSVPVNFLSLLLFFNNWRSEIFKTATHP